MKKIFFVFAMVAVATLASCSPGVKQTGNKNLNFTGDAPIVISMFGNVDLEAKIDGTTYKGGEVLPTGWAISVKSDNNKVIPSFGIGDTAQFSYVGIAGEKGKFTIELKQDGKVDSTLEIPFK